MYNDFFGFREQPFNVTPDPRVFYATPSYQKIYNGLVHSIREGFSEAFPTSPKVAIGLKFHVDFSYQKTSADVTIII